MRKIHYLVAQIICVLLVLMIFFQQSFFEAKSHEDDKPLSEAVKSDPKACHLPVPSVEADGVPVLFKAASITLTAPDPFKIAPFSDYANGQTDIVSDKRGNLYAPANFSGKIVKYNKVGFPTEIADYAGFGIGVLEFMTIGPDTNLYVADNGTYDVHQGGTGNPVIFRINPHGTYGNNISEFAGRNCEFENDLITGLAYDPYHKTLFAGGSKLARIYKMDSTGKVSTLAEGVDFPQGMAFYNGNLYVNASYEGNPSVIKIEPKSGKKSVYYSKGGNGIVFDTLGNMYLSADRHIYRVSPSLAVTPISVSEASLSSFGGGMAFDDEGNLLGGFDNLKSITKIENPAATWLWNTGATTKSIKVSKPDTYQVNFVQGSCTSDASIPLVVSGCGGAGPRIYASGKTGLCSGESVILMSSAKTGNVWSTGETTQTITVSTAGKYWVQTVAAPGCSSARSNATVVIVHKTPDRPTITVSGPTHLKPGETVKLTSSAKSGNLWSTGEGTRSITVSEPGKYFVNAINHNCTSETSLPIEIERLKPGGTVLPGQNGPMALMSNPVYQFLGSVNNPGGQDFNISISESSGNRSNSSPANSDSETNKSNPKPNNSKPELGLKIEEKNSKSDGLAKKTDVNKSSKAGKNINKGLYNSILAEAEAFAWNEVLNAKPATIEKKTRADKPNELTEQNSSSQKTRPSISELIASVFRSKPKAKTAKNTYSAPLPDTGYANQPATNLYAAANLPLPTMAENQTNIALKTSGSRPVNTLEEVVKAEMLKYAQNWGRVGDKKGTTLVAELAPKPAKISKTGQQDSQLIGPMQSFTIKMPVLPSQGVALTQISALNPKPESVMVAKAMATPVNKRSDLANNNNVTEENETKTITLFKIDRKREEINVKTDSVKTAKVPRAYIQNRPVAASKIHKKLAPDTAETNQKLREQKLLSNLANSDTVVNLVETTEEDTLNGIANNEAKISDDAQKTIAMLLARNARADKENTAVPFATQPEIPFENQVQANPGGGIDASAYVVLSVKGETGIASTLLYQREDASEGLDEYDKTSPANQYSEPNKPVINTGLLALDTNALPAGFDGLVPVNVSVTMPGWYEITAQTGKAVSATLHDKLSGQIVALNHTISHKVFLEPGSFDRFMVHYKAALPDALSIYNNAEMVSVFIGNEEETTTIEIINAQGQVVKVLENCKGPLLKFALPANGMYTIRVTNAKGIKSKQVVW